MNIRNKVKYSYAVLIFFIFVIIFLNQLGTYFLDENEHFSEEVNKLINVQDKMNININALVFEKDPVKLESLKKEFFRYEKEFESIEESLNQKRSNGMINDIENNVKIKRLLKELYDSEKDIDEIFEEIYDIRIKLITLQNRFGELYPVEHKMRKRIEKGIEGINTLDTLKAFDDIKYYGKETLYQYKDTKTLGEWMGKFDHIVKILEDEELKERFLKYKQISEEIAQIAIESKLLMIKVDGLNEELKTVLKSNEDKSSNIEREISNITHEFLDMLETYQVLVSALVVLFALFISRYISSKLADIINIFSSGVGKLKKGDYEVDIFIDDNEFNGVASAFNEMAKSIKVHQDTLEQKIKERTIDLESAKKEIEQAHKHTRDSIEYASLIQHALIPDNNLFKNYFQDYFTLWQPKDIVGGDIYLFEELRDEQECLLMVIDCTGHGVPGAFVTMLVKAIERQIAAKINHDPDEVVSPAKILGIFNRSMKHLLKQDCKDSISNAGFDGGIIYYNKKEGIVKFSGAETPLFYVEEGEVKTIKGSRHSVGYKKSDSLFTFEEHTIKGKEGMEFYITTDGYLDQNGGDKEFPFGKRRFLKLIKENHKRSFGKQKGIFIEELENYQDKNDRNDDITLIGLKL